MYIELEYSSYIKIVQALEPSLVSECNTQMQHDKLDLALKIYAHIHHTHCPYNDKHWRIQENIRMRFVPIDRCLDLSDSNKRLIFIFFTIVMSRQPHWFRTWTESPLRVASQRSNQLGQRVRPAGEKLAGRLDCHIPPFLNGTRHPCLSTRHFHQAREKHDNQSALSELSMR